MIEGGRKQIGCYQQEEKGWGGGEIKRIIYNNIECTVTYLTVDREACRFESEREREF